MTEIADRYRKVAAAFTQRVEGVPEGAWDNPAPCEGWVARDVVRHVVEWMPSLVLAGAGLPTPEIPSADDDPAGAWAALDRALRSALEDPALASREVDSRAGVFTVEEAIARFCIGDVLVHTWDLARATGQDETLDPDEVHGLYEGMVPMERALRESGHYGPRVEVPDDADEQTKLLAFSGRRP